MATSTKKKGDAKAPETVDVAHEVVPFTPDTKPAQPLRIYTTAEITELYLQQLSPAERQLAELEQKFAPLVEPIDLTDKAAYKAGKDAWREVQAFRTRVENQALSMRREQNTINKAIATKEGEIVGRTTPLETRLQARWLAVDQENQRLEREAEARQEQELRVRLDQLTELGMTLADGYYGIGDTVTVDVATLRVMPPDKFENLCAAVTRRAGELRDHQAVLNREEEARQEKLEQERQQARQANKETRSMVLDALGLVAQDDGTLLWTDGVHRLVESEEKLYDLDHYGFTEHVKIIKNYIREFQEQKKREVWEERERQERQEKQNRWKARTHALLQAGLTERGRDFIYEDGFNPLLRVFSEELAELDDAAFSAWVIELSAEVGELRTRFNRHEDEKREQARLLKLRKDKIAQNLERIGFKFQYTREAFEFPHALYNVTLSWEDLLPLDDQEFEELVKEETARITAAMQRQAKLDKDETERLERERLAELGDDGLFQEYLMNLYKLQSPPIASYKTAKSKKRQSDFNTRLNNLLNEFKPKSAGAKKEVAP